MSFWKSRNTPQIPPVQSNDSPRSELRPPYDRGPNRSPNPPHRHPSPNPPSHRQDPYGTDPYASGPTRPNVPDRYRNLSSNSDNRGGPVRGDFDPNGEQPSAGYIPESPRHRWEDRTPQNQEEEDEDVEGIKRDIRTTKQESVNSTRNALRIAREAEETARNTLVRLGEQTEKLIDTEHHLDKSKVNASRAEDDAVKLKALNRSIFVPSFTFNKEQKRQQQAAKVQARYEDERNARESASQRIRESQNRVTKAVYGDDGEEGISRGSRTRTEAQQRERMEQRKKYQFESTQSDDELEDELDDNLDEIADVSRRLKALASAQGNEIVGHNKKLSAMAGKVDGLDSQVRNNTNKLNKIT